MGTGLIQIGLYLLVLLILVKPLGAYMARVYSGERTPLDRLLRPVERLFYRLAGVNAQEEMDWQHYALAMLLLNGLGFLVLYLILRLQHLLPFNPEGFTGVGPHPALNIAISFVTNTNWQNYGGETTLGYLPQMLGLTVQNFLSAATGMTVLAALLRGLARHSVRVIGNFWVDLTRTILYILLPLSLVLALILVSQGVVQTFRPYQTVPLLQTTTDADGNPVREQVLALGPAASQIAIKQLGTNGGGFFNVNSAHPLENPTPLTNFFEMLAILLLPAALCYTFGRMVGDTRQGWAVLIAMNLFFIPLLAVGVSFEYNGNPLFAASGVDQTATDLQPGGNMEGKEIRFGVVNSALWAVATTAASNGSVIFNALIIMSLVPLALRGVPYRPVGAAQLLRTNLLIYGGGGLIVPFIGIKVIDMILVGIGVT